VKTLLIVGVGSIGLRHLRCFCSTGRVRISICETNRELRERVGQQHAVEHCYADLEAALADRHDAAVIATPAHLHVPIAIRLAEAGMHLLVEKPVSTSMVGIERLSQVLAAQCLVAAVGYDTRANPLLQAMKEAIGSGRFGQPVQVVVASGHHFPTARPAYREIYYRDRASGGGAIQDALTHNFNTVEWLVGPIERLVVDAAHQVLEGIEVEDTVHVMARHGRVLSCFALNQYQAPSELTITVVCECGTLRFESHLHRWRWMVKPDDSWHDEPGQPLPSDAAYIDQANRFLDAVESRVPPLCTLEDGIHTLRANLAALASAEQGTWQTL
jgi:predicted dehydrogenase